MSNSLGSYTAICSNACKFKSLQRSSSQAFYMAKYPNPSLNFVSQPKSRRKKVIEKVINSLSLLLILPTLEQTQGFMLRSFYGSQVLYLRFIRLWYTMQSVPHRLTKTLSMSVSQCVSDERGLWWEGKELFVFTWKIVCATASTPMGKSKIFGKIMEWFIS